ncbi:MAG: hypothetical protein AAGD38_06115 [Acidobacteriota bacterium]
MSDEERYRRPEPERTEPDRRFSTLLDNGTETAEDDDPIRHGVRLGYQVIDEHLEQGRRIAREINDRAYGPNALGRDMREMAERMIRFSSDVALLCVEMMTSFAGFEEQADGASSDGSRRASFSSRATASTPTHPTDDESRARLAVEIDRPSRVSVDLAPGGDLADLHLPHGLRGLDPNTPPLDAIELVEGDDGETLLRIQVPDDQPLDRYTGVVLARSSGEVRGTVAVHFLR